MLGGIEAGGTKFVCLLATDAGAVIEETRFPTGAPHETIAHATAWFRRFVDGGGDLAAIGIAAFGPLELRPDDPRYGHIVTTPKSGWSDTDIVGPIREAFDVPVGFDTDVNGAALAEGRWGAAQGLDDFVYMTVGTGIGGGAIVAGRPVHGLVHPEMGHLAIPRARGDAFAGACPFHGDCFEGMASGTAIADRWGKHAEAMSDDEMIRAVDLEATYLAAGVRNIVYTVAPQRVIIGGGVSSLPGLFPLVRSRLVATLGGYPGLDEHGAESFVVPPGLGGQAGPLGAIALADLALRAT
jgi:fructokinase